MKKLVREVQLAGNNDVKMKYYRVENQADGGTYYGIAVEKYRSNVGNYTLVEYEEENGVTYSLETVTGIVELLANNEVMPGSLYEILDDLDANIDREADTIHVMMA